MDTLYLSHDILVHPSICESFGLVLLEAEAYGLGIVATDIDVARELALRNAVLVDPYDSVAWANAIQRQASAPGSTRGGIERRTWSMVALELAASICHRLER